MAAAVLELTYFDPIISQEKPQFFRQWHLHLKVCEERPGTRFIHNESF
jgi:hypothetical protein